MLKSRPNGHSGTLEKQLTHQGAATCLLAAFTRSSRVSEGADNTDPCLPYRESVLGPGKRRPPPGECAEPGNPSGWWLFPTILLWQQQFKVELQAVLYISRFLSLSLQFKKSWGHARILPLSTSISFLTAGGPSCSLHLHCCALPSAPARGPHHLCGRRSRLPGPGVPRAGGGRGAGRYFLTRRRSRPHRLGASPEPVSQELPTSRGFPSAAANKLVAPNAPDLCDVHTRGNGVSKPAGSVLGFSALVRLLEKARQGRVGHGGVHRWRQPVSAPQTAGRSPEIFFPSGLFC